jgi:phosphonoacetaldehyde hydrolase
MIETFIRRSYRGPLKAVVLDWAGTTVDYGSCAPAMAIVEVFERHGVPVSVEEARGPMGKAKWDHIQAILRLPPVSRRWEQVHGALPGEADVERLYRDFVPLQMSALAEHAALIPGMLDAAQAFREMGLKIGSTTGYTREMMDVLVPLAAAQGYRPDSVVHVSSVPAGRPAPWMALQSAMELGVYPMEAVVKVGDTLPDIEEGLNAGMWAVGVALTGNEIGLQEAVVKQLPPPVLQERLERAYQRLHMAGAHAVVDGIWDVPRALESIADRLASGEKP